MSPMATNMKCVASASELCSSGSEMLSHSEDSDDKDGEG